MLNYNEFVETAQRFKEIDVKKLPPQLMVEIAKNQARATMYAKEMEKFANKTVELMKQAIVLDGINKAVK